MTGLDHSGRALPPYPLDLAQFRRAAPADLGAWPRQPERVAELALGDWNAYLRTNADTHRRQFLGFSSWLLATEQGSINGITGWPRRVAYGQNKGCGPHLSARVQSIVGSTLLRAHLLLDDEAYLRAARRALKAFEAEILDGGVGSLVGFDGYFFEDVAVYPAVHNLSGFLIGLVGLNDYFKLFTQSDVGGVIERSMSTLHSLIGLYDTGYWTRVDLSGGQLTRIAEHSLHVSALRVLASYSGCEHCGKLAERWAAYERRRSCHMRRAFAGTAAGWGRMLVRATRRLVFSPDERPMSTGRRDRVCITVPAFPVAGGTRAIMSAITDVMADDWDVVYLTHKVGPNPAGWTIEQFGGALSSPWQFPNVWFHVGAGLRRLTGLVRRADGFRLILPQDGSYTAFYSAIVGKASGARLVSVEHGTVMFPYSAVYRAERVESVRDQPRFWRGVSRLRLAFYWPSLRLMATVATRLTDQFLVAGDEIEETYHQQLGVHPSRIIRFNPSIDFELFKPLDRAARERERTRHGMSDNDLIILMNGRLAPEKGLDIAMRAVAQALEQLPSELRIRVRMVIAGDGPARRDVEEMMRHHSIDSIARLCGEARPREVAALLGMSDIFLYTSLRGTNTSLAVLEAMAAGCTVVASEQPQSHAKLLADGRGISTTPGDLNAVRSALLRVLSDDRLRLDMGSRARDHVMRDYSSVALKRAVMRATFYSPMQERGIKA